MNTMFVIEDDRWVESRPVGGTEGRVLDDTNVVSWRESGYAFVSELFPFGNIIGPLIVWQRETDKYRNGNRDLKIQRFLALIVHEWHIFFHLPDDQRSNDVPEWDNETCKSGEVREHAPLSHLAVCNLIG